MRRSKMASMQELTSLAQIMRAVGAAAPRLLFISFFYNVLALAGPIYMVQVYERVLASRQVETLILLTLMLAVAVAVYALLDAIRGWMLQRLAVWVEMEGFRPVFRASVEATLKGDPKGAGPMRHLDEVQGFVAHGLKNILDLPFAPLFFIAAFYLHFWIGVVALVSALILFALAIANDRMTRPVAFTFGEAAERSNRVVGDSLRYADTLRAMGMDGAVMTRWRRIRGPAQDAQRLAGDRAGAFAAASKFVRTFAQSLVLGVGAWLAIEGEITVGLIIAGTIILGRALTPIDQLLGSWRTLLAAHIAYTRLIALDQSTPPPSADAMALPKPEGGMRVEGLVYQPRGAGKPVLNNISFDVDAGQSLVIFGPSGAGKSSLVRTLVGAGAIDKGKIEIDHVDMAHWSRDALGPYIGYLPQEIGLFPGTVRENIARMAGKPDDEAVFAAAEAAGVLPLINAMPRGFDTVLGAGGGHLSGGQKQRIGLARALYGQPPIILLDEPTAHLDQTGMRAVREAIELAKGWGASVIYVTHDNVLVHAADKMLILAAGEVNMFGPSREVVATLAARPKRKTLTDQSARNHDGDDEDDDDDPGDEGS